MNEPVTPASLYALLIGGTLALAGVIGFFYSSSFGSPGSVDAALGVLGIAAGLASPEEEAARPARAA